MLKTILPFFLLLQVFEGYDFRRSKCSFIEQHYRFSMCRRQATRESNINLHIPTYSGEIVSQLMNQYCKEILPRQRKCMEKTATDCPGYADAIQEDANVCDGDKLATWMEEILEPIQSADTTCIRIPREEYFDQGDCILANVDIIQVSQGSFQKINDAYSGNWSRQIFPCVKERYDRDKEGCPYYGMVVTAYLRALMMERLFGVTSSQEQLEAFKDQFAEQEVEIESRANIFRIGPNLFRRYDKIEGVY